MTAAPSPRRHAWQTSSEAASGRFKAVLIPVGDVEQHGPHLPLGVDIWLSSAVAAAVTEQEPQACLAEPLAYGISPHHLDFAGTVSLRYSTFIALLTDVCAGFAAQRLLPIIVNGHGGKRGALLVIVSDLGAAGVKAAALTYFDLIVPQATEILPDASQGVGHACALKTSPMMHVLPNSVRHAQLGTLKPGSVGDVSILSLEPGDFPLADVRGEVVTASERLFAKGVVIGGQWWHPRPGTPRS